jgi:hypothetical protein
VTAPLPDVREASARLEATAPGYLQQVRRAAARLSVRQAGSADLHAALAELDDAACLDLDPPTASTTAQVRVAKDVTKRLVGWYVRYVGDQVAVLGTTTGRLGRLLADRIEGLEADTRRLETEIARLAARVERLERDGP